MAQVTFHLPKELEDALRKRASQSGQNLSVFLAELVRREIAPDVWSQAFLDAYGSWEGECEEPADPPPENGDSL